MYSKGEGVPKDYVRAYAWLNLALAAEQNYRHRLAEERRNTLQERINTLQEHMTVDQIAEAQKLSHELAERIGGGPLSLPLPFEPPQYQSNGSGFIVSDEGHIVTNYHVIENCDRVTVNLAGKMYDAEVATTNADNDLALLKAERALGTPAAFSRSERAPLNSDVTVAGFHVTVAGFPLQGILSKTLNVTRGSVSSEHGLGGNSGKFQLTAPIQGGNSGGPVLDKAGNVVGVVVSKLADKDAQNVNFAIKSQRVRGFLDLNGVSYRRQSSDSEREPERIASMAKGFTVAIYCYH
ncbi:MAG: putative serine protease HhoB [Verrucomicrobia subdivision 3 bacterium]|nr:putative serine protease HhoB [Limisphaerales bacterium]